MLGRDVVKYCTREWHNLPESEKERYRNAASNNQFNRDVPRDDSSEDDSIDDDSNENDSIENDSSDIPKDEKLKKVYGSLDDDCVICYEPLIGTQSGISILICGHLFHAKCCKMTSKCPLCRN